MTNKLLDKFTIEKSSFKKLLIGSRMIQVSYNETFQLFFKQNFDNDKSAEFCMVLILDALCWFGNRDEWLNKRDKFRSSGEAGEREDCLLAYELIRLRYHNLIRVKAVEFQADFLSIIFEGDNILSIAYDGESDYAWILEEVSDKREQDRMMICCRGNELFQNNIPKF